MGLHEEIETPVKAKAVVAFSVVLAVGGDRQISFNGHFDRDDDPDTQNEIVDRIMQVGDRQKAKYDLAKQEAEFEEAARHLRNFLNAIPMAEKTSQHQIATLKVELQAMEEARRDKFNEYASQHVEQRRKGLFVPRGAQESTLRNMDIEIDKKRRAIEAAPKDAEQQRGISVNNIYAKQDELKKRRAYINDLRSLAGLGPHTFMEGIENEDPLGAKGA